MHIILGLALLFILLNIFLLKRFKSQTETFLKEIKSSFIFQAIIIIKLISRILKMIKKS